jgi:hypothetical protein
MILVAASMPAAADQAARMATAKPASSFAYNEFLVDPLRFTLSLSFSGACRGIMIGQLDGIGAGTSVNG